jgi:hypothetical protein
VAESGAECERSSILSRPTISPPPVLLRATCVLKAFFASARARARLKRFGHLRSVPRRCTIMRIHRGYLTYPHFGTATHRPQFTPSEHASCGVAPSSWNARATKVVPRLEGVLRWLRTPRLVCTGVRDVFAHRRGPERVDPAFFKRRIPSSARSVHAPLQKMLGVQVSNLDSSLAASCELAHTVANGATAILIVSRAQHEDWESVKEGRE